MLRKKIDLKRLKDGCEFGLINTITDLNLQLYSLLIKRKVSIWNVEILLNIENQALQDLFDYGLFKHSIKKFSIKQSEIIRLLYAKIDSSIEEMEYILKKLSLNDDIQFRITLCNDRLYKLLNETMWSHSFDSLGKFLEIDSKCLIALKQNKILIKDFSLIQEKMIGELFKSIMVGCYKL